MTKRTRTILIKNLNKHPCSAFQELHKNYFHIHFNELQCLVVKFNDYAFQQSRI